MILIRCYYLVSMIFIRCYYKISNLNTRLGLISLIPIPSGVQNLPAHHFLLDRVLSTTLSPLWLCGCSLPQIQLGSKYQTFKIQKYPKFELFLFLVIQQNGGHIIDQTIKKSVWYLKIKMTETVSEYQGLDTEHQLCGWLWTI